MPILLRPRTLDSLTKSERDDLARLIPWTSESPRQRSRREGLEGLSVTILLPTEAGKKAEDLTRSLGQLCAEFAWSSANVALDDGPLDGVLLRFLDHRARETQNALVFWASIISARKNSEQPSQEVLDYLFACAVRLFNGGSFDSDSIAQALLLKPRGISGPSDIGRRTVREDAETLLALLLSLRVVGGTKMIAARREVARFTHTSEATVTRAWNRARRRCERILGAFLALTNAAVMVQECDESQEVHSHFEVQLMVFGWIVRSLGGRIDAESARDSDSRFL